MVTSRNRVWERGSLLLPVIAFALAGGHPPQVAAVQPPGAAERAGTVVGGGGVHLSVYEAGTAGAPPIVFIHGFSQNSLTWAGQLAGPLADRFHLVALDMRGHGASDKPRVAEQYTSSDRWAEDIDATIRGRNLQRPVLVGWSYGGYVIADYIRRYGDEALGGVVFLGSSTKNGSEEAVGFLTPEVLEIFGDVLSPETRRSMDGARALAGLFTKSGSPEWEVAFGSAMMVPPEVRLALFSRELENDDVLARIRVPALVVHGTADRIVRVSAGEHTARTVPGARLLLYEGAGHAPHLDDPARFARDLAEFVGTTRAGARP